MKDIQLFLLDMDGTIYLDNKVIDGAVEKIREIKQAGKKVCYLTNNSSRSISQYVDKLNKLGFDANESDIYTSGNATISYLQKFHKGKKVFLLGTSALALQFENAGIVLTDQFPDIVVIAYDTGLTYANLCKAVTYIAQGCTYIATHGDVNCPSSPVYVPDVGSFMALIEKSCNRVPDVICGKPFEPIADGIRQRYSVDANSVAMIGDRLYTDMRFALNNDFTSILVLSGETTKEQYEQSGMNVDCVLRSIKELPIS